MAGKSRFGDLGASLKEAKAVGTAVPVTQQLSLRVGKRRHPDFKPTSVVLNRVTQFKATRKLQDRHMEGHDITIRDFSELVNHLLDKWLTTE